MYKSDKTLVKYKILVTPKEACDCLDSLPLSLRNSVILTPTYGRIDNTELLVDYLKDKDGVILDLEPITPKILLACRRLKIISRFGEGCDAINIESAKELGVRVAKTKGVSSLAVARHTLTLILSLLHRVTENDRNLKSRLWLRKPVVSEESLTLGILGFGKIGQLLADFAVVLGFKVLLYNRTRKKSKYPFIADMEKLIANSDVLSLHLPLTIETKKIISKDIIKKLSGKYLVNTARGGLVDEKALLESLGDNGILGYAADVFSAEPISGISRKLARHPNVICSPHIAALDKITSIKMTRRALENAINCLTNTHERVNSYVER